MHGLAAKDLFRFAILSSHFYKKTLKIEVSQATNKNILKPVFFITDL